MIMNNKQKNKIKETNLEPIIDSNNYNQSLSLALNYYNENFSLNDYKNNSIDYSLSIGIDIPKNIPEIEFRNIGAVCRLLLREQFISIKHIEYVISRLNQLKEFKKDKDVPLIDKPKIITQDTDTSIQFIIWLDDYIDSYILNNIKKIDSDNIKSKYTSYIISKNDDKKVIKFLDKKIKQFESDYNEYQINTDIKESYGDFNRNSIKNIINTLSEFKKTLITVSILTKKPKKEKPVLQQVSSMKYLKSYNDITGVHPKDVINKRVVYMYDTDTRDFIVLYALASKFKASGMSFTGLDESKCKKKKIRKPEDLLNTIKSMEQTKEEYKKLYDSIKTTEQKSASRMSDTKIILKVF